MGLNRLHPRGSRPGGRNSRYPWSTTIAKPKNVLSPISPKIGRSSADFRRGARLLIMQKNGNYRASRRRQRTPVRCLKIRSLCVSISDQYAGPPARLGPRYELERLSFPNCWIRHFRRANRFRRGGLFLPRDITGFSAPLYCIGLSALDRAWPATTQGAGLRAAKSYARWRLAGRRTPGVRL